MNIAELLLPGMLEKIKAILKRPLYITIILIVVLASGGYWYWAKTSGQASYEFIEVVRGQVTQEVSVTGRVKPAQNVDLAFERGGRVARINVAVGDRVVAGQGLAVLENSDLAAQVLQAKAGLAAQQAQLDELKAGTRPEELQIAQTNVANAQKSLADAQSNLVNVKNKAEVDLNNLYNGVKDTLNDAYIKADDAINKQIDELFTNDASDNPKLTFYTSSQSGIQSEWERRTASVELTQFKQEIDNLPTDSLGLDSALVKGENHLKVILNFLNTLSMAVNDSTGLTATTQASYKGYVNTGRTNVTTALTSVSAKKQALATQKATNQSSVSTAETSVNSAQSSLRAYQDQLALKQAGATPEQINAQAAQVMAAQANVANAQAQLNKTLIISPIDGIITKQDAKIGEIAAVNASVISILSAARFEIEANVSENEISKVKIGDAIEMTLDALGPAEKFSGKIIKIDPAETIVSGVIYYKVTSVFNAEDARIKSGMTVNLDIQTDKKENVLSLPYYVVKGRNGEKYVQVLVNNQVKEKIVKTGLEGETMIEIIDGLDEGQKVIESK